MVKRSSTHVTDTLAIRTILGQLSPNWLVRNLEERDYGIDLTIEFFDGSDPTGKMALIQVKGTESDLTDPVKLSFPTKTIEYSLLFNQPFFVFHTSTKNKKTYFVWIQNYVHSILDETNKKWRIQETVMIEFPIDNILESSQGRAKIDDIMSRYSAQSEGLKYLASYERFLLALGDIGEGLPDIESLVECIKYLCDIKKLKRFLDYYSDGDYLDEIDRVKSIINSAISAISIGDNYGAEEFMELLDEDISFLARMKTAYLNQDEVDKDCALEYGEYQY